MGGICRREAVYRGIYITREVLGGIYRTRAVIRRIYSTRAVLDGCIELGQYIEGYKLI